MAIWTICGFCIHNIYIYIYIYTRIIYGLLWIVWVVHGSSMNTVYDTMDGRNPAPGNRWFIHVYPIIYRLSTIPGGAGFLPSAVLYPSDCWLCQCNKWHSRWNVDDDSRSWFPTARSCGVSMSSACARPIKGGPPAHETIGKWSSNQEKIGFHGIHRWSIIAKLVNITPIWFMILRSIVNIHGACKPPCGAGCDGMLFGQPWKNRRGSNEQWTIWGVNFW